MFAVASQIVICLLLAAIAGMIIGYFLGRISCMNDDMGSHHVEKNSDCDGEDVSEENNNDYDSNAGMVSPVFLQEARSGGKDNLTRIKGVGSKIEEKLNDLGVFHFDQIASWSEREIAWVDHHLAFRGRIGRENWVEQARILAEGGETDFSKRVDAGEVSSSKKQ